MENSLYYNEDILRISLVKIFLCCCALPGLVSLLNITDASSELLCVSVSVDLIDIENGLYSIKA